jgi:hypothetical protein
LHKELLVAVIGTALSLLVARAAPVQEGNLAQRIIAFRKEPTALADNRIPTRHLSIPREICAGGEIVSCYAETTAQ